MGVKIAKGMTAQIDYMLRLEFFKNHIRRFKYLFWAKCKVSTAKTVTIHKAGQSPGPCLSSVE